MKAAGRAADGAGSAEGGDAEAGNPDAETRPEGAGRLRRASDILSDVLFGGGGAARATQREEAGPDPIPPDPIRPDPIAASVPPPPLSPAPAVPRLTWSAPAPGDEATRYLCAATHIDAVFARRALKEFVFDEGRAPAPSTGVDEVLVLRHALAARTRRLHRDISLVALMIVALLVSVWTVAGWLVWGLGLKLLLAGAGGGVPRAASADPADPYRAAEAPRYAPWPAAPTTTPSFAPLARFMALVWGVGGAAVIASAAGFAHPFGLTIPDRYHKAGPGSPFWAWVGVPLAGVLVAWLIVLAERLAARHVLVDKLRRDRFATHRWVTTETVWARRALAELAARVASDRQVLADPARPFAGAGRQVLRRRWLLETGPIRYDVEDLIERVTDALAAGVPGLGPEGLLDAVAWDDFVVATGPVLAVGQTTDASLRLLPSPRVTGTPRVFRRFRVLADPAETVVTVYLSASAAPGLALVEIHGLVLEPVAAAYRGVDRLPGLGVSAALVEGWHAAADVPRLLYAAPRGACGAAVDPWRWRHRRSVLDRAAADGLPAANGARTSLRELGVASTRQGARAPLVDREGAPFAREDANLALAVVERRVREALRPLL